MKNGKQNFLFLPEIFLEGFPVLIHFIIHKRQKPGRLNRYKPRDRIPGQGSAPEDRGIYPERLKKHRLNRIFVFGCLNRNNNAKRQAKTPAGSEK
jgi:hypothetical protein